jgi:hypothetical protein
MLGYRMFAWVDGDRDQLIRHGREQFHSWLREKGYDADLLEPGQLCKLDERATSLLLERSDGDGSRSFRARLVEDDPTADGPPN